MLIAITLCGTLRKHCDVLGYNVLLICWTVDMALVGLVAQQFYIYWTSGTFSCCFCNPGDVDHVSRFQGPITYEVCNTRLCCPATHILHRFFVIVQFFLVTFQSIMYALVLVNED